MYHEKGRVKKSRTMLRYLLFAKTVKQPQQLLQLPTSCDGSTTSSGYIPSNAGSLSYDPVMPAPSGSCLPYSPFMHPQHQPHPHPMSMQFSTGIGDIRFQSPSQWSAPYWPPHHTSYPSYSETEFRLCFYTGNVSVCNGCRNKFDKTHTIFVCNMKSGACTCHLQRICRIQDLEMLIIMQTQQAS